MIPLRPLSGPVLVYFVLFASLVLATLQNITVDDAVLTGAVVPQYLPNASAWNIGNTCIGCLVKPDPSLAYNGTWHDTTYAPNNSLQEIEFTFTGSALYIFFILANNVPYATTYTNVEFVLDYGDSISSYEHNPQTTTNYQYNVPVYANESLASGQHTMLIQPINTGSNVLILFDYLVYTTDTSSSSSVSPSTTSASPSASPTSTGTQGTSSGPNIGAIVGAVCGVLVLVAGCLFCYRRYRRRNHGQPIAEEGTVAEPFFLKAEVAPTSLVGITSPTNPMSPSTEPASATGPSIMTMTPQPSTPPASTTAFSSFSAPSSTDPGIREQVELLRAEVAHLRNLHEAPPEYSSGSTD